MAFYLRCGRNTVATWVQDDSTMSKRSRICMAQQKIVPRREQTTEAEHPVSNWRGQEDTDPASAEH